MMKEILKEKTDMKKLSKNGKQVIYQFDKYHFNPSTKDEIMIVSRIMVMSRWIKECEEMNITWEVDIEDGLPYIIPIYNE